MQIYLYRFDKKQNSTYFPSRDSAIEFDGALVNQFDVCAPVVKFALPATAAPQYNHAEIPAFGRKYFIDSWFWQSGRWVAQLTVDALATYKDRIGAQSLYILRSSAEFDGDIIDTQYPGVGGKIRVNNAYNTMWLYNSTAQGIYVVGIVNNASGSTRVGATSYYAFRAAGFAGFMAALLGDVDYLDISATEISESLQKAIVNPMQYITSVIWFPYSDPPFNLGTAFGSTVPVGWWSVSGDFTAYAISGVFDGLSLDVAIPKHPQAASRGNWLNKSPYAVYSLEVQPFGVLSIDADKLYNVDTLHIVIRVDHVTGVGVLRAFTADNATTIVEANAQIGVPIQLAQLSMDWGNLTTQSLAVAALAGGASTIAPGLDNMATSSKPVYGGSTMGQKQSAQAIIDYASGGGLKQDVTKLASNIGSALNSVLAEVNISGANGATAVYSLPQFVNAYFTRVAEDDNEHNGRPLCKIRRIDTIPGFVMVKDAEIGIGDTMTEQALIREYLEGGIFFE